MHETIPQSTCLDDNIFRSVGNVIQLLHVGNQVFTAMDIVPTVSLEGVKAVYSVDSCFRSLMVWTCLEAV